MIPLRAPRERKRREAIPDSWAPTEAHRAKATEFRVDVTAEAEAFRDFHRAKGNVFADVDAAFRTWLRNAKRYATGPPGRQQGVTPAQIGLMVDELRRQGR